VKTSMRVLQLCRAHYPATDSPYSSDTERFSRLLPVASEHRYATKLARKACSHQYTVCDHKNSKQLVHKSCGARSDLLIPANVRSVRLAAVHHPYQRTTQPDIKPPDIHFRRFQW
jgi:hypothetical protein